MNNSAEKNRDYEAESNSFENMFDGLSGISAKIIFNEKLSIDKKTSLLSVLDSFVREIENSGLNLEGAEKGSFLFFKFMTIDSLRELQKRKHLMTSIKAPETIA